MVSSPRVEKPRASASSSWDALADIEVFITAAEAELVALERERTGGAVASLTRCCAAVCSG
jgi:hypothetical protein